MAEYLKRGEDRSPERSREIRDAVSEILSSIEAEGVTAVRRHSQRLDGWNPERFAIDHDMALAAGEQIPAELRDHIEAARQAVTRFARLQRESLLDIEVETQPGVVLGHRHVPEIGRAHV